MKMSESLKTCKDRVDLLLACHAELQDSDKKLWLAYLNRYHNLRSDLGEAAYNTLKRILLDDNTPTMESVRRVRQKLQEQGKYVGKKRRDRLSEASAVREAVRTL